MLRKVRTSPHSSSKLSFQKGKQSLSASLKFFEHIFIWSEEKPEYTSTEAAEREVLSHIFCLKALSNAAGVLRSSSRMAEQDLVLAELLRVWVHTSLPKCLARGLCLCRTPVLGLGSWGHPCSVTNGFPHTELHPQQCSLPSAAAAWKSKLRLSLLASRAWL